VPAAPRQRSERQNIPDDGPRVRDRERARAAVVPRNRSDRMVRIDVYRKQRLVADETPRILEGGLRDVRTDAELLCDRVREASRVEVGRCTRHRRCGDPALEARRPDARRAPAPNAADSRPDTASRAMQDQPARGEPGTKRLGEREAVPSISFRRGRQCSTRVFPYESAM